MKFKCLGCGKVTRDVYLSGAGCCKNDSEMQTIIESKQNMFATLSIRVV